MKIIDYTQEPEMMFYKLVQLEKKRQKARSYADIEDVIIALRCDCCNKIFRKHLYDINLCLSFCCTDKCLKEMERIAREEIKAEMCLSS